MIDLDERFSNQERFIELISSIEREGIDDLVNYIKESDFFDAPASTKYHCNYDGGLCEHSLNVYDNLLKLVNIFSLEFNEDSVKIVSLLHDFAKINFYEKYEKNVKIDGQWTSQTNYKIREPEQRFIGAMHGTNSVLMISKFIPLTDEELISIINHHMGLDDNSSNRDLNAIYNKYPLAALTHMADTLSTYINENDNTINFLRKYEQDNQESTEQCEECRDQVQ